MTGLGEGTPSTHRFAPEVERASGRHVHRHTATGPAHAHPADHRELLHEHGLRATEPRLRVLAVLSESDHLTAEALHQLLEAAGDTVALTTVYRTLESLEKAGLVWATHVPEVGRTFHLGSHLPHGHLYCRVCGSLTDLAGSLGAAQEPDVPDGFVVERIELTVVGRCASCQAAGKG